ncbi:hypothetical protein CAEBREN_00798 [Caenorhabditis brenneri]|uniref:Uncharacterized protein n=1 Tax=Caenorhabditis brenneri TaxID=135651 RepID=G0MMW9_CAEBE|nr:hypothetical protein CAEBREN_00798 [Caenorhabditis brenneri]
MIETLRNLCVKQAAKHIAEGLLTSAHQKLDVESSNLVFEKFLLQVELKSKKEGFSECCQHIKNLLRVTKFVLVNVRFFDDNLIKLINDQDVVELQIWWPENWKIFHLDREQNDEGGSAKQEKEEEVFDGVQEEASAEEEERDSEDDEENSDVGEEEETSTRRIDLIAMLETLLNPQSCQNLQSLLICGEYVEFLPGWVEKLATLLPSLRTLSLCYVNTEGGVVESICNSFPNLIELDIENSVVTNLRGISKLSNLTSLKITGLDIKNKEDIAEFFALQKLKTLKIGGDSVSNEKATNLMYYLQNNRNLPQLTFFDCAYCDINELMFQTLIDTHRSLKIINLLGTNLENRHQLNDENRKSLKLWSLGPFGDCLYTLDSAIQNKEPLNPYIFPIRDRLVTLLENQYDQISQEELSECLKLMCTFMKDCFFLAQYIAGVLELLCRDERASRFSFVERQHLIFTIIQNFHTFDEYGNPPNSDLAFTESIWIVLANSVKFNTSPANLDRICEDAAHVFHTSYRNRNVCVAAMLTVREFLEKMSTDRRTALARRLELTRTVVKLLMDCSRDRPERDQYITCLSSILYTIYKFREEESEQTTKVDKKCVKVLCQIMGLYKEDLVAQSFLVLALGKIIDVTSDEALMTFLENKDEFPEFMKMFYNQKSERQKATICTFYIKFVHSEKTERSRDELLSYEAHMSLIADVQAGLDGFEETDDVFEGLRWIVKKCKDKITKEMCTWMIKEFGGEEKKTSRKRRRN